MLKHRQQFLFSIQEILIVEQAIQVLNRRARESC